MSQLGYYGKTPHRGDFVRFNLPQTFITIWDDWLQTTIAQSESLLQSEWTSAYDSAPTYRFILSAGIAGNTAWAGCMSAQRDKVGRRFPFCIAMSLPDHENPASAIVNLDPWFKRVDMLMNSVHQKEYVFDELQPALEAMIGEYDKQDPPARQHTDTANDTDPDNLLITLDSGDALQSPENTLSVLSCILHKTVGEYSVWMTNAQQTGTVISAGLPTGGAATALFSKQWNDVAATTMASVALSAVANESMDAPTIIPQSTSATSTDSYSGDDTQPIPDTSIRYEPIDSAASDDESMPEDSQTSESLQITQSALIIENSDSHPDDQTKPSADDWAALADFETDDHNTEEPIVPTVEPLELDEDANEDAPWET